MSNDNNLLIETFNYIRKDSGTNNVMEAMEQLSILLLVKYVHVHVSESIPCDSDLFKINFREFLSNYGEYKSELSLFRKLIHNVKVESHGNVVASIELIQSLHKSIPLRIRSRKILDRCIDVIDAIDFYDESLAEEYEYLLEQMTNQSVSSGAYCSPKGLVKAIVRVINPKPTESIYDPALGTGSVLIESVKIQHEALHDNHQNVISPTGHDYSPFALLLGAVNLALNHVNLTNISIKNSLTNIENIQYDVIISGLPFGKIQNLETQEYGYLGYPSSLEGMFLKHSMDMLADGGRAALIIPDGMLFNISKELIELRRRLFKKFNLHTILSLPNGILLPYTNIKVSVIFFEKTNSYDDIWLYELKPESRFTKNNRVSLEDLNDFIKLFMSRGKSLNSSFISKDSILNTDDFSLNSILKKKEIVDFSESIKNGLNISRETNTQLHSTLKSLLEYTEKLQQVPTVKRLTLKEIFKPRSGKALNKSELADEGMFAVYGANGHIGYYRESNRPPGSIVIGRVGANCGNIHYIEKDFWLTNNSFSLDFFDDYTVYPKYFMYVLRSLNLNRFARGTAQPFLSFEKIKDISVALPSFKDQVEISEHFDFIQEKTDSVQGLLDVQHRTVTSLAKNVIAYATVKDYD